MKTEVHAGILIATLGTEPQVVTAALDLLRKQGERVSQVVVIHTTAPGTPIESAVGSLIEAFHQPPYLHTIKLSMRPIASDENQLLEDVETPQAGEAAFRLLYREIRLAKASGYRVHLSIAGGRKNLAVFGMVAAQLLFDEGDCLWHLYSGPDFLDSKRLHPAPGDQVHLIPIPVIHWSKVSPILLDLGATDDPFEALDRQRERQLAWRLEEARAFVRGSLTPSEERVVSLLVREGLSDQQIAARLVISPRTVEGHLRAAYNKAAAHWELPSLGRTQLVSLLSLYYSLSE